MSVFGHATEVDRFVLDKVKSPARKPEAARDILTDYLRYRLRGLRHQAVRDKLAGEADVHLQSRGTACMRKELWHSFSTSGLLLGTLFFVTSLTPSLLPRTFLTQGVLSGFAVAAGYGIGAFGVWLWAYMELPQLSGRFLHVARRAAATGCAIVAGVSLWHAAQWQNSIRELMELEPVDTAHPVEVSLIALAVFAILITLARLFRLTLRSVATRVNQFLPGRMSNVVGVIAAAALFWWTINGVLFRAILRVAEASFQEYDALIEPDAAPPTSPLKTGSSASLLAWDKRFFN